jgi:predicted dehydrogenase
MQIALIGAGGIAQVHCSGYDQLEDARITAVIDTNPEAAARTARRYSATEYTSIEAFLAAERPDAVDICSPTYFHAEQAALCLEAGLHVLCEKPMSLDRRGADRVMEAWKRSGKFLMIAQVIRFWPEYMALKNIVEQRPYGALRQVFLSRTSAAPGWGSGWYLDPALSGMAPFELHVHDLDFVYYLLGKPRGVRANGWREDRLHASYLRTHLDYPGILVEVEAGWYDAPVSFAATYRAVFERAVLDYRSDGLWLFETGAKEGKRMDLAPAASATGLNLPATDAYASEIAYFCGCVRENRPPEIITPLQSREVMEMLFQALESS